MGMTMTQKILAAHAGLPEVKAGQLIRAKLDMVLGNDITSPVAIREFEKEGFTGVFDKSKISMVMDHFTPNKDIKAAEQCLQCRTFARQFDLDNFYDVGQMGVEHALLPEKGLVAAGECIIGADSHTCTYGALGAFSTGVGSTDMAAGMATGEAWFKVPEAIRVHLTGKLQPWVSGKDVILHLIGLIGVDGALYQSLEYCGDGVAALSMDDRLCIANMSIEAGAKNGIFPVDAIPRAYLDGRVNRPYTAYEADPDAEYVRTVEIDLSQIEPTVAFPHLPENAHPISQVGQIKIDQVVIGSCTNWRTWPWRPSSWRARRWPTMSAASSCLPPSTFSSSALTWAICPPSSRLAALSPPPPAAPAWAATWESWPTEKSASPPPTGTLWAAWAASPRKFIWQAPPLPPPPPWPASSRTRGTKTREESFHAECKGICTQIRG